MQGNHVSSIAMGSAAYLQLERRKGRGGTGKGKGKGKEVCLRQLCFTLKFILAFLRS